MNKLLLSAVLLLASMLPAGAATADPPPFKVQILEEGVFGKPQGIVNLPAPGTAAGKKGEHDEVRLLVATRRLKAELGATFGFRYKLTGMPRNKEMLLEMRAVHPPMKGPGGKTSEISVAPIEVFSTDGSYEDDIIYTLAEPFEVLPGRWLLQITYQGKQLMSREFTLE